VAFSVYEGPSTTAVRRLDESAGLPICCIVEAIAATDD
jgi:hypothetical protein